MTPTPRAMFRILSVTCLLTHTALRLIIILRLAHVLHVERFCMRIIPIERQRFEYFFCYRHCGCPTCVSVCLFVVFCHRVHLYPEI